MSFLFQIVEEEALIKNNNTCKDFLIEAMKYHLLPADQRHLIKTDRTRPRTPISIPKVRKHTQCIYRAMRLSHHVDNTQIYSRFRIIMQSSSIGSIF